MATITVGTIKTRARNKADMVNSNFIGETELLAYVNESYFAFYDLMVSRFEDYNLGDPTSFTISSGSSTHTVDADFYKLVGIDKSYGGDRWYPLRSTPWRSRNRKYSGYIGRGQYPMVSYRLTGTKIRFTPEDSAAGDYRYWYIPLATALTQDSDTIERYNGFEELVVIDTAIKMLAKEESDINYLLMERQRLEARILEMAQQRDINEPGRIEEVEAESYQDGESFW